MTQFRIQERPLRIGSLLLATIVVSCLPAWADDADNQPAVIALTGGTVVTQDDAGTLEGATVLIRDGKIEAVGTEISIPENATTFDVSGMTITPGLIDVRSTLWLTSRSASQASTTGSMIAADGIDPFSDDWIDVARQGVTSVYVQPAATSTLGGRGVVLRVAPGTRVEDLTIKADAGVQASLGLTSRNSSDRYKQYTSLKKIFDGVIKYQAEWKKYKTDLKKYHDALKKSKDKTSKTPKSTKPAENKPDSKKPASTSPATTRSRIRRRLPPGVKIVVGPDGRPRAVRTTPTDSKKGEAAKDKTAKADEKKDATLKEPKKPKKDKTKDALAKVLTKDVPLRLEIHRADDAINALKLAKEFKINVIFEGISQLGGAWDEVRKSMIPLVVGPIVELEGIPSYRSRRRRDWQNDINIADNRIAIGSFTVNGRGSRFLRTNAAAAVAQGMDPDRVLQAITSNAAKTLGVADQTGMIKKGYRADIAVFAGNPLDPSIPVRMTIAGGQITHNDDSLAAGDSSEITDNSAIPARLPDSYAIRSQRILMPNGRLRPGTIVVANGQVSSVGKSRSSNDTPVYDVGESIVSPGLINGHFSVPSDDRGMPDSAHVLATDNFDPSARSLAELVRSGFTAVALAPGSSNVLSGQIGCVRIGAADAVAPRSVGGKFVLASGSRSTNRFPATLSGQVRLLDGFFNHEPSESDLYVPTSIQKTMLANRRKHNEAITSGKQIAVIQAENDAEIRAALQLIERYKLKANLLNPIEFAPYIAELKRLKVGIIARPLRISDYDWYVDDLAKASNAGIRISFGSGTATQLRITAAMAVNAGMKRTAALRSLTSDAAAMCGLRKSGRLRAKAPADLVIWSGSPLDLRAKPIRVIVDGHLIKETL
jgi:imidazolonepropionase-like amidohydrolase